MLALLSDGFAHERNNGGIPANDNTFKIAPPEVAGPADQTRQIQDTYDELGGLHPAYVGKRGCELVEGVGTNRRTLQLVSGSTTSQPPISREDEWAQDMSANGGLARPHVETDSRAHMRF